MFIRSSINQHSSLNIAASDMCDFFVKYVSKCDKPKLQLEVLMIFIKQPGTIVFDKLTRTKTISNIIQHLKSSAIKSFAEILKSIFVNNNNENEEVYNDHTRGFAVNQISLLVGHPALVSNISWKKECVQFLLLHSFFKIKQPCDDVPESSQIPTEISDSIREVCLKSFIRSLEFLFRSSPSKKSNLQEKCEMMSSILHYTNTILNLPDYFIPLIDINQIKEYWEDVITITNKLQKQQKKDGKLHESCAFQTLFVYLGLQLFIDPSETIDILQELKECCNHALKYRKKANKLDSTKDESNNEPSWIEVIIELMLSLLSQSSHLTRSIVMAVFPLFCPFITENALKQILNVINPKTNSDENNPLTKTEDDDEQLSFESGSDEEMDDDDDQTEVNDDLRSRLQAALGNEVNDDSEHYMSDSEMFKLDDAIAQAFAQQKKPDKKTTILEQTELVHFRMRCLDLLPLFLKSEPLLELVFSIILPLIDAMEYGYRHEKQVSFAKKIETLFSLLIKYKKNANNINQLQFSEMLQKLMDKAKKATDLQIQKKLSQLCIYVVMCSKKMDPDQEISEQSVSKDWFIEDYKKLLKHFLETGSTHIQPEMFTSMLNACPETVWNFTDDLSLAAFSSDFRLYKRTQILEILLAAIRCMKNLPVLKKKVWKKFFIKLMPNVIKALQDIINSQEIKPTYTIEVLDIIVTVEETNTKFGMSISKDCQDIPELKNLSPKQRQKLQSKGRRLWKRVAQLLSIELS
ncbi:myb-binding protein 1A-like protein [Centruroides vittatus]|uniref:myb-binding protein 1A-like protein n=1 Tax=Centruroides vittatus TaxID=120091 RepID=UPI003510170A